MKVSGSLIIPDSEIEMVPIRAQGAGGQNVNKVSSAIHLRFDIPASSLSRLQKEKLLAVQDQRLTRSGVFVIKAQQYRTQEKNRTAALDRLAQWIRDALQTRRPRRPTKPTRSSQRKRLEGKTRRGRTKSLRRRVQDD